MTPSDYQRAAARTLAATLNSRARLSMLALGVVGEWSEYEQAIGSPTEAEEAGDVLWYIAGMCTVLGVDMAILAGLPSNEAFVVDALGNVCEPIKKHLYHGKDLDKTRVLRGCAHLYLGLGGRYDLPGIMAANIDKLRKRWPDGFGVGR